MKALPILTALLVPLSGQESNTKWDVSIPTPISEGASLATLPEQEPKPIEYNVLTSRTERVDVSEAPPMPGLPPVTGTINVTLQLVEDPGLPDPVPPLPPLPPDDPVVIERLASLRARQGSSSLAFISATVYDNLQTFLRIYPNGKDERMITAWSNLDFNHFRGFSTFRVRDAVDGSLHDVSLLMGIGNLKSNKLSRAATNHGLGVPDSINLPDLALSGPAFLVVEGDAASPAMNTLEQIHDLYRNEGARMKSAHHARIQAQAERRAHLLANPPKPDDIVIRFWQRDPSKSR